MFSRLYNRILYILTIIYLFFIPFGSYPIFIYKNIKLDYILEILLILLILPVIIKKVKKMNHGLVFFLSLYLISIMISVFFSYDIMFSFQRFLITLGYILLMIAIPIIYQEDFAKLSKMFVFSGIISGLLSLILYNFLGFNVNSWGRYTIPTFDNTTHSFKQFHGEYGEWVDPNLYSFGLLMTTYMMIPIYNKEKNHKFFYILMLFIEIYVVLLTKSRTTIISFLISFLLSSVCIFFKYAKGVKYFIKIVGSFFIAFLTINILFWRQINNFLERLTVDYGRIYRYQNIISETFKSYKSIFIGNGYYTATKFVDPHNLYLEHLYGSGLLGLIMFLLFLCYIFMLTFKIKKPINRFTAQSMFFYILFGSLFYFHTKTFWVPISLIYFIYLHEKIANKGD